MFLLLAMLWAGSGCDTPVTTTPPSPPMHTAIPSLAPTETAMPVTEDLDISEEPAPEAPEVAGTNNALPRLSEEEEIEIGQEVAVQVEQEYGIYRNPDALSRVTAIGERIAPHSDRPQLVYHFTLLDTDEINAFAVPGGFIYVTRGMLDFVASDDELAGIIGHEIAHVARRHGAQKIEAITLAIAAGEAAGKRVPRLNTIYQRKSAQIAATMTEVLVFRGWSRKQEYAADTYGTLYMAAAGYDPQAILVIFGRMQQQFSPNTPGPAARLLSTHPPFEQRIENVEKTITEYGL